MSISRFRDPKDQDLLHELYMEIREIKSGEEALEFARKYAPDWIICEANSFAKMYSRLTTNWNTICNSLNTRPQKILLVEEIHFRNSEHTIMEMICEILTRAGFCVRRKCEFDTCSQCDSVIFSIEMFETLSRKRKKELEIVSTYDPRSGKCSDCCV